MSDFKVGADEEGLPLVVVSADGGEKPRGVTGCKDVLTSDKRKGEGIQGITSQVQTQEEVLLSEGDMPSYHEDELGKQLKRSESHCDNETSSPGYEKQSGMSLLPYNSGLTASSSQPKEPSLQYQDSDSYPSVSPSPDPDSRLKTFEFDGEALPESTDLTAALQTEKEFIDFMFSLPQLQKKSSDKGIKSEPLEKLSIVVEDVAGSLVEKRSPAKASQAAVGSSRVGLDHLDNLCRMMEQLKVLREQNTRLQRRVQYLEDLRTLHELHQNMQKSLEGRQRLAHRDASLSISDLRLDELNEMSQGVSQESLTSTPLQEKQRHEDNLLELPQYSYAHQRRSSSEDDRRHSNPEKVDPRQPHDKDKKRHKSAWGKVKNMITSGRRESERKKSLSSGVTPPPSDAKPRKSSSSPSTTAMRTGIEPAGGSAADMATVSDLDDYELDYEQLLSEANESTGFPLGTSDPTVDSEGESGGIWMGPRPERMGNNCVALEPPHFTVTVPSNEDLTTVKAREPETRTLDDQQHQRLQQQQKQLQQQQPSDNKRQGYLTGQMDLPTTNGVLMTTSSSPRSSHWAKVKQAILVNSQQRQDNSQQQIESPSSGYSPGSSPTKKESYFSFDVPPAIAGESPPRFEARTHDIHLEFSGRDSPESPSQVQSDENQSNLAQGCQRRQSGHSPHFIPGGVQRNLAELQKTLTGEFTKRLHEWERMKLYQGGTTGEGGRPPCEGGLPTGGLLSAGSDLTQNPEENLPHEFRKKLHEWEKLKVKGKEKEKHVRGHHYHDHHQNHGYSSRDFKTKVHGEDSLPPEFKKRLTEWEIGKALAGKSQQNVEELQKNLGEEFNRKLAEWEKIKASGGHMKPSLTSVPSKGSIQQSQTQGFVSGEQVIGESAVILAGGQGIGPGTGQPAVTAMGARGSLAMGPLDRKGSGQKIKKKVTKQEKSPLGKGEGVHKQREKDFQWLEKELSKIEREKQRLEREKEKYLEREARLETMRNALHQGPVEKKEIYIKTSTGEFRFEGISQTFTRKLYEWEERRGIRPESSTIALLGPTYQVPEADQGEKPRGSDGKGLVRSKSESSVAEMTPTAGSTLPSQPSSLSLNKVESEEVCLQDAKAASEPTLAGEEVIDVPKCALLVQLQDIEDDVPSRNAVGPEGDHPPDIPYAPAEITRLIDSSGSEDEVNRRQCAVEDDEASGVPVGGLRRSDSTRTEASYRSLLHENMTLLDRLRQQEDLCRILETQMGDIDTKMDTVADQHLKTLEKLHRQVIMMKDGGDHHGGLREGQLSLNDAIRKAEANQSLIKHLKTRIIELEVRGDHLKKEKEELERAFKLHKKQETQIAESLVMRIRELQDAGAEVNIQPVLGHQEDSTSEKERVPTEQETTAEVKSREEIQDKRKHLRKKRRKKEDFDEEDEENRGREGEREEKEQRRRRKTPPKKVQKLHNLTGDLLFQAKRIEHVLVAKHQMFREVREGGHGQAGDSPSHALPRHRSLRGRSSLRLAGDSSSPAESERRLRKSHKARTWSSNEAISLPVETQVNDGSSGSHECPSNTSRDQQELLAMNAELSRMARELRKEMMTVWSFRESTSPESVASDGREEDRIEEAEFEGLLSEAEKPRNEWLAQEAKEVFENIALLNREAYPTPSTQVRQGSPSREASPVRGSSKASPSRTSDEDDGMFGACDANGNTQCGSRVVEDDLVTKPSMDATEVDWWEILRDPACESPLPVWTGIKKPIADFDLGGHITEDDTSETHQGEVGDNSSVTVPSGSGATLKDLLTSQHQGRHRRRSSDGASTITSGPSRSRSPSPSIASSGPEPESLQEDSKQKSLSSCGAKGLHLSEEEMEWGTEDGGVSEELQSPVSSISRLAEHVLSSSFEWEADDKEAFRIPCPTIFEESGAAVKEEQKRMAQKTDADTEARMKTEGNGTKGKEASYDDSSALVLKILQNTEALRQSTRIPGKVSESNQDGFWSQKENGKQPKENARDKQEDREWTKDRSVRQKTRAAESSIGQNEEKIVKSYGEGRYRWKQEPDKPTDEDARLKHISRAHFEPEEAEKIKENRKIVKESKYVTEVTSRHLKLNQELRTRRISDTQVEYENHKDFLQEDNTISSKVTPPDHKDEAKLLLPYRDDNWKHRNEERLWNSSSHVFVPTKRTIFTVHSEGQQCLGAQATPIFVETLDEDYRSLRDPFGHILQEGQLSSDSGSLRECTDPSVASKAAANDSEYQCSVTDSKEAGHSGLPTSVLDKKEVKITDFKDSCNEKSSASPTISLYPMDTQSGIFQPCHIPSRESASFSDTVSNSTVSLSSMQSTSMIQSPPSSPPTESKRRVLEAANQVLPTVRNMIQLYNQRITENQELLISPFRDAPRSPVTKKRSSVSKQSQEASIRNGQKSGLIETLLPPLPPNTVLKSHSDSTLPPLAMSYSDTQMAMQRSASGLALGSNVHNKVVSTVSSASVPGSGLPSLSVSTVSCLSMSQPPDQVAASNETVDSNNVNSQALPDLPPSASLRAVRLRKAKEEFFSRGGTRLNTDHRLSGEFGDSSVTISTEESSKGSCELNLQSVCVSAENQPLVTLPEITSPQPSTADKQLNIPHKESFRRQSDGFMMAAAYPSKVSPPVPKSASSGFIGIRHRHYRPSADSQHEETKSPEDSCKSTKGIRKFFKYAKGKSQGDKDISALQKLCRQSLNVDIDTGESNRSSASPANRGSFCHSPHAVSDASSDGAATDKERRATNALPRGQTDTPPSSARSCPSSPVAQHKTRAAIWLARGRNIFKSRSPSPNKQPR